MYCNYTGRTRSKCTKDALDNGLTQMMVYQTLMALSKAKVCFVKLLFSKTAIILTCTVTIQEGPDQNLLRMHWTMGLTQMMVYQILVALSEAKVCFVKLLFCKTTIILTCTVTIQEGPDQNVLRMHWTVGLTQMMVYQILVALSEAKVCFVKLLFCKTTIILTCTVTIQEGPDQNVLRMHWTMV